MMAAPSMGECPSCHGTGRVTAVGEGMLDPQTSAVLTARYDPQYHRIVRPWREVARLCETYVENVRLRDAQMHALLRRWRRAQQQGASLPDGAPQMLQTWGFIIDPPTCNARYDARTVTCGPTD